MEKQSCFVFLMQEDLLQFTGTGIKIHSSIEVISRVGRTRAENKRRTL